MNADRMTPTDVWDAGHRSERGSSRWFPNLSGTIARLFGRGERLEVDAAVTANLAIEQMALDITRALKYNGRDVNARVLAEAARLLDTNQRSVILGVGP